MALGVWRRHLDPSSEQTLYSMKLLLAYTGLRVQSQADAAGQLPRMEGRLGICGPWNSAPAFDPRPTYTHGRWGESVQGSCVPGEPMARSRCLYCSVGLRRNLSFDLVTKNLFSL